jgi:DNA helicase-2/ATP-dependent DNA helicase PcrA
MKYYVTQQSRMGDRHIYGARSRFMTPAVMACFQEIAFGERLEKDRPAAAKPRIDVAATLRGMWS